MDWGVAAIWLGLAVLATLISVGLRLKEALGIGLAGFFAPFLGASFLADFTYEGGRGISGAFLGTLGATGLLVGVVSGVGEFLGYAVRLPSGQLGEGRRAWPLLLGYGLNLPASRPGPFSPSDGGGLIPFYAESLVLGHQWKRVCRLRVSGAFSRTRHRSATTYIISSRS